MFSHRLGLCGRTQVLQFSSCLDKDHDDLVCLVATLATADLDHALQSECMILANWAVAETAPGYRLFLLDGLQTCHIGLVCAFE